MEKIRSYWNSLVDTPNSLVGCYPMGGGGLMEAGYRHFAEARHLKQLIPFHQKINVLELGCGSGRWPLSLAPLVETYIGVDFSQHSLSLAERSLKTAGISNATLIESSVVKYQPSRNIDIVYFSGVTQYLQDDEIKNCIQNVLPWLNPGAVLIDRSTLHHQNRVVREDAQYYSIYRTAQQVNELFASHGFKRTYHGRSYRYMRATRYLHRLPLKEKIAQMIERTAPYSFHSIGFLSYLADQIAPVNREYSHDFSLFYKQP